MENTSYIDKIIEALHKLESEIEIDAKNNIISSNLDNRQKHNNRDFKEGGIMVELSPDLREHSSSL